MTKTKTMSELGHAKEWKHTQGWMEQEGETGTHTGMRRGTTFGHPVTGVEQEDGTLKVREVDH